MHSIRDVVRKIIKSKGMTNEKFRKELIQQANYRISNWYFYWLLNNPAHIKIRDIKAFSKVLDLTNEQQTQIFLIDTMENGKDND